MRVRVIRDVTAPTVPTNLVASPVSQSQVHLSWNPSTDDWGVAKYQIFRNGALIGESTTTSYDDIGLAGATTYQYSVLAVDNGANKSAQSSQVPATTPDQTAPSVPTGLAAQVLGTTSIRLTWNASTDTGGSGVQGYRLYRGGLVVGSPVGTTFDDTGLTPATLYSYRVSAVDNATNESAQSSPAVTATTQGAGGQLAWTAGTVTVPLTVGVPVSFNLNTICTGPNPIGYTELLGQQFPAGLTLNHLTGIVSGTPLAAETVATTVRAYEDDWAVQSAGALVAAQLATSAEITAYVTNGPNPVSQFTLDTVVKPLGAPASFALQIPNVFDPLQQFRVPFAGFGPGQTMWVQMLLYLPTEFIFNPFPAQGFKSAIIAHSTSTDPGELVWQSQPEHGIVSGYTHDGQGPAHDGGWQTPKDTSPCNGSDHVYQNMVDNGANPLTGNNPTTGNPWTACDQKAAQLGGTSSSENFTEYMHDLGATIGGGFRFPEYQWAAYLYRLDIGTFGAANSRYRGWCAPEAQPYRLLVDRQNVVLGTIPITGLYDAFHGTSYMTDLQDGGKRITAHSNLIPGVEYLTTGLGNAAGTATLQFFAASKTFQYTAPGGAPGAIVGVNALKKYAVCFDATRGSSRQSWRAMGIRVKDLNALPTSNVTDNITIANGRATFTRRWARIIVKGSVINAPNCGVAPVG